MNILDFVITGYVVNFVCIFIMLVHSITVYNNIGRKIYKAIIDSSPKYSNWILIQNLIPFIGIPYLIKFVYQWNSIQAENLIDRFDKFTNRKPCFISKFFLQEQKDILDDCSSSHV